MKIEDSKGQVVLYKNRLEVRLDKETVWLTQKQMAELFQKDVRTINEHIKNIFAEGELVPESVIWKFRITAAEGKTMIPPTTTLMLLFLSVTESNHCEVLNSASGRRMFCDSIWWMAILSIKKGSWHKREEFARYRKRCGC
jgi:hypothetical protein